MRRRIVLFVIAIGLVSGVVLGWITIRRGFSARDNPSALETYGAIRQKRQNRRTTGCRVGVLSFAAPLSTKRPVSTFFA